MTGIPLKNLQISNVTKDILLVHQSKPPHYFSCCDGLLILPQKGRNSETIALDINIEPEYVQAIIKKYGPVSDYVNTHGHMDHITNVHAWERLGVKVHAPSIESKNLLNLNHFYETYGWNEGVDFSLIEKFAELNKYHECNNVRAFEPGTTLQFEDFTCKTISFKGHSRSHVGFLLPSEEVFHISCLGFDRMEPGRDGFGPWYGFKQCSIKQYLEDITHAESIFLEKAKFLTSSHAYIVKNPDTIPFEYMREKIRNNQEIVDQELNALKLVLNFEEKIEKLLKMDLFFPKRKMKGVLSEIYYFWEKNFIEKHVQRSRIN
jgi:glyoxylase-like metal-dependent hydrolase (beta-lactamase superfamily II)